MNSPDPIKLAASKVGGIVKLSEALGLSRGAVSNWTKVPPNHVLEVERLSGVPREILRPDLYPVELNRRVVPAPAKAAA